jgi:hypothetical protein
MDTTSSPDWSKVPDSQIPTRLVDLPRNRQRRSKQFIPPVPLDWFDLACRLPGKALAVGLILWRQSRLEKSKTVVLTQTALNRYGVTRWQKYPALRALEGAGLISIRHRGRRNPAITLLYQEAITG